MTYFEEVVCLFFHFLDFILFYHAFVLLYVLVCWYVFHIFFFFSDYVAGGELFTHLYQREHFTEDEVRIYIGEIILALEHLHAVSTFSFKTIKY